MSRRLLYTVIALLVVAAAGALIPVGPGVSATRATPSAVARAYYTANGAAPRAFPLCSGTFGFCRFSPIERARRLLGLEDQRNGAGGELFAEWNFSRIHVSTISDKVGSIGAITVTTPEQPGGIRVALPRHLLLGKSRMGDVRRVMGPPLKKQKDAAENSVFNTYAYYDGCEGTCYMSFTYSTTYGSTSDPRRFGWALNSKLINQFSVCDQRDRDACVLLR